MESLAIALLLATSTLLVNASVLQFYESGIRFESGTFPGWFIGFFEQDIQNGEDETILSLIEDSLDMKTTLWYLEQSPACSSSFYIRSHAYPEYYMTFKQNSLYISRKEKTCFSASDMAGGAELKSKPKNLTYYVALHRESKTVHYVDSSGPLGEIEGWSPKYNGEFFAFEARLD